MNRVGIQLFVTPEHTTNIDSLFDRGIIAVATEGAGGVGGVGGVADVEDVVGVGGATILTKKKTLTNEFNPIVLLL
jgi:hypothetical protein